MAPLVPFTLDRLKAATNGFGEHRLLGKGGFANAYLGVEEDSDGRSQRFAVKVATVKAKPEAFEREIERVKAYPHHNLVRLIGYCHGSEKSKEKEQILVYQFAFHGSLHDKLFDKAKKRLLSLDARMRIAEGTARAAFSLHEKRPHPSGHKSAEYIAG